MLDVKSNTRGMLIPRLTSVQITEIQNPVDGLQVYNTEVGSVYIYLSSLGAWKEIKFTTGTIPVCDNPITDIRDGKSYNTVMIGTQCWMAENMNIGIRINGSQEQTNNSIIEKYCYNDLESNCDVYGGLYQWAEMVHYLNGATNTTSWNPVPSGNVTGLCPTGWHVPKDAEWTTLTTYLSGVSIAGGKMKEAGTTHWASPNTGATNSSGFTALPGGDGGSIGGFYSLAINAYFWSSSEYSTTDAWYRNLICISAYVGRSSYNKADGFSGRCVKD